MPVITRWYDENQTIILNDYSSPLSVSEVVEAVAAANVLAATKPGKTVLIHDMAAVPNPPHGTLSSFPVFSARVVDTHALRIVVTTSSYTRMLFEAFRKMGNNFELQYVATRAEALEAAAAYFASEKERSGRDDDQRD